jgi:uncharacterized protein
MSSGIRVVHRLHYPISINRKGIMSDPVFDLPGADTYYTRPMPPPWFKPLEIERVSRDAAVFGFDVALADLPRVASRADQMGGNVAGTVRFGRHERTAIAHVLMQGTAVMCCQRCMRPVELPVSSSVRLALLENAEDVRTVTDPFEPVLALRGRISVGELVEEELLLSLPIVPLHAVGDPCPRDPRGPPRPAVVTQRPLAELGKLLSQK